jgi:hypothetical protein
MIIKEEYWEKLGEGGVPKEMVTEGEYDQSCI